MSSFGSSMADDVKEDIYEYYLDVNVHWIRVNNNVYELDTSKMGKEKIPDPYVKIKFLDGQEFNTKHYNNNREINYLKMDNGNDKGHRKEFKFSKLPKKIIFELWDENMFHDDYIGKADDDRC